MKKIFIVIFACIWSVISIKSAYAQENTDEFELESEDFLSDADISAPQKDALSSKSALSDFLSRAITAATIKPIQNAEAVFCYVVDYASADSDGYTVNGLAVKGYCGELSAEGRRLIQNALLNNTLAFSKSKSDCRISPKILLRYVHGIDYTDILLSSPCPSLTFFHGNDIVSVNATPGTDIINKIVTAYESLKESYSSAALLGQMVGNGVPQTQAQKEILNRNTPKQQPLKKWSTESVEQQTQTSGETQPTKSGWNRLK